MADGFLSVHPLVEDVLRSVGVTDAQVRQGWGNAVASAGTHAPTGRWNGRVFGRCVDLSWWWPWTKEHFDGLIAGGIFPFRRQLPQWTGSRHIHCVCLSVLPGEFREWPGWVRVQVEHLFEDLNGLVSERQLDQWAANADQKSMLRQVMGGDEVLKKVQVYMGPVHSEDNRIAAYAYLQENSVRCNLRPLVERLGGHILWEPSRPLGILIPGRQGSEELCPLPVGFEATHEGNWTRCRLRPVAEWFRRRVTYDAATRTVELT